MNNFEKNDLVVNLFDLYKEFLTDKQRTYFEYYFFEDFSLQEIAEEHQISRAAVSDSIQKAIKLLEDCEEKIHLLKMNNSIRTIVETHKNSDNIEVQEILKKLEKEI